MSENEHGSIQDHDYLFGALVWFNGDMTLFHGFLNDGNWKKKSPDSIIFLYLCLC